VFSGRVVACSHDRACLVAYRRLGPGLARVEELPCCLDAFSQPSWIHRKTSLS
jgi:hypothetical protein